MVWFESFQNIPVAATCSKFCRSCKAPSGKVVKMLLHTSRRDVKAVWIAVVVLRRGQKAWKNLTLFWICIECIELGKWFIYEVRKKEILGMPVSSLACDNEGWWHSHWDSDSRSKAKYGGNLIVVLATQWNGVIRNIRANMSLGPVDGLETQKTFWPADTNKL